MFGDRQRVRLRPGLGRNASKSRSRRPSIQRGSNQALRNSPTNFTYNHIGHFADAGHAAAKGIFLGGVTRRFPELRFAFLEGGVGWGAQLFGDLMEHWERRNIKALENMKPEKLDRDLLMSYVEKYGYKEHRRGAAGARRVARSRAAYLTGGVDNLDDFAACKFTRKEDWVDLYAKPYYFGCEADDRMNATAFLQAQPVRRPAQRDLQLRYRAFRRDRHARSAGRKPMSWSRTATSPRTISATSSSPTRCSLWGTQNPDFFKGTRVEKEAAAVLKRRSSRLTPTRRSRPT